MSSSSSSFNTMIITGGVVPGSAGGYTSDNGGDPAPSYEPDLCCGSSSSFSRGMPFTPPDAPAAEAPAADAPTLITQKEPVIQSGAGCVYKVLTRSINNTSPDATVFTTTEDKFKFKILPITNESAKSRTWLLAKIDGGMNVGATALLIAEKLFAADQELGAVVEFETNGCMALLRKRRCNLGMFRGINEVTYFAPLSDAPKGLIPHSLFVKFLREVLNSYPIVVSNYIVTDELRGHDFCAEAFEILLAATPEERQMIIARANMVRPKSKRTGAEAALATSSSNLLAAVKIAEETKVLANTMLIYPDATKIFPYERFDALKALRA